MNLPLSRKLSVQQSINSILSPKAPLDLTEQEQEIIHSIRSYIGAIADKVYDQGVKDALTVIDFSQDFKVTVEPRLKTQEEKVSQPLSEEESDTQRTLRPFVKKSEYYPTATQFD